MSIVTPERPVDATGAPTPPHPSRSWLHAVNGVIALGAIIIGVVALTRDPATKTVEVAAPAPAAAAAAPSQGAAAAKARADAATAEKMPAGWPATEAMQKEAAAISAAESSSAQTNLPAGGVASDKYADRVPAYQYDIAKQHAPVSRVDPDPTKTIVRR
jgi:hypothetical protein